MKLSSSVRGLFRGKAGTFVAVAVVAGLAGTGASVAAGTITSAQIKDGTIQTRDLTKNNFAKFTSTENVVSATTPVSTVPAYAGGRVVDVPANTTTPLVTLVLDKGTWKINGTAQFWHIGPGSPNDPDYGVVTIPGLQDGFGKAWTADVPDGGANAAQTSFNGTIKITANDTPVVISGAFTNGNAGQAGVSVQATQYEYVKLFHGGH
jgi:F0F1-type ATP synthase membrane subunit c/vacuolar-type H+-ATPase subunit K